LGLSHWKDQEHRDQTKRDALEKGTPIQVLLMQEAAISVVPWSTKQLMHKTVHDHLTTGMTRVVVMTAVL